MKLSFAKMHGCGNDYIYFDCFHQKIEDPAGLSRNLSRQHFGIGGDGIILIGPSDTADAQMRIFNKDGSEGKMCGNGIRCTAKFLYDTGLVPKETMTIDTLSGIKTLRLSVKDGKTELVTVDMGPAEFRPEKIPVLIPGSEVIGSLLEVGGKERRITCVSMGNPHCVIFGDDPDTIDLEREGTAVAASPIFPEGVNVEFIHLAGRNTLKMRVWERGSGETLACGTGACAAACAAVRNGLCEKGEEILVHLTGGDLRIRMTDETVWMTGGATLVFTGEVEI
ncbi:MAG TPA: diaminopimelate epimerase [Candidatus Gallacutalibacter pullicola]|uniref:Diaminopimelate epimerase n=1 Tax=Candidatus Gallacutalibacter pullicola TaxID=2840830 RepID=A0A9D1J262_9FIRM|nr:diaminopimelate epimerase [Candidatus Gallacutalibacter pullicola]